MIALVNQAARAEYEIIIIMINYEIITHSSAPDFRS